MAEADSGLSQNRKMPVGKEALGTSRHFCPPGGGGEACALAGAGAISPVGVIITANTEGEARRTALKKATAFILSPSEQEKARH